MKKILGLDIGYGSVKVVLLTDDGTIEKIFKFPSVIGITNSNEYIEDNRIYWFKDNPYYVGEMALTLPSKSIVDITDYKNLEYYAPLFLCASLRMIGCTPDIIVSGLSKSQIQNSGYFKDALKEFTVSGINYKFDNVYILPQGAGSKLTIDKYGVDFPKQQTEFNGQNTFVGVDIGFNTLDMFLVANGKTSPNLFEGIEHEGVMRIAGILMKEIKDKYNRDISYHEAQEIISTGTYKLRGQKYDMKEVVKKAKHEYLKHLIELINQRYDKIIDKSDFIFLSGGGSAFFTSSEDGFIRVPKSHYEYYNSIGFALWGLTKL